jgi:hypothetical protein
MEIVKNVILASIPKYQAIFTVMTMAGLDEAGFMYWNRTGLDFTLKQLREKPNGPIRIELPGRKSSKNISNYYTFFGADGIDRLKNHLNRRGSKPGLIFKTSEKAMINYWMRQLQRLGYVVKKSSYPGNRYGLNLHRLRGIFRSRWRLSGVDVEIAEFFMGHDIDPLGYDVSPYLNPEWFEEKYMEAEPWLNILTEDPQQVPKREVTELRRQVKELEAGQTEDVAELKLELENMKKQQEELMKLLYDRLPREE